MNVLRIMCASLAGLVLLSVPAAAKECQSQAVSATSREYLSRSLGAWPGSWAAWRKEVKEQHGNGWQAWRRAEERNISCDQNSDSRRWTCTRVARPCRAGGDGTVGPTEPDYAKIDRVLSRNMSGKNSKEVREQVKTLQYLLNEAGNAKLEIDGDFGARTVAAVRAFQRKNKLKVDGRAGPQTILKLTS